VIYLRVQPHFHSRLWWVSIVQSFVTENHHHKWVLWLRSEYTLTIFFPFNRKFSSKSLFKSLDGPKKVNRHPQQCHIKGQDHQRHWGYGPPRLRRSAACYRGHWLFTSGSSLQHPTTTAVQRSAPFYALVDMKELSRWRKTSPSIMIGRRRLSTMIMPYMNRRRFDRSTNNSKPKSLPSRTLRHRHSRKASLKPKNLPMFRLLMS